MGGLPLENGSTALALSGSQLKLVPNNLTSTGTQSKAKKKISCACPDAKKLRDECIVQHGEDACAKWMGDSWSVPSYQGLQCLTSAD